MSWIEIIGAGMLTVLLIENAVLKRRTKELEEMLEKQNTEQSEKEKP